MNNGVMLSLLRRDLERLGASSADDEYYMHLIRAAKSSLSRQGIKSCRDEDYMQCVIGTAAWMYRKRINGEAEPSYLRRLRHDLKISQTVKRG